MEAFQAARRPRHPRRLRPDRDRPADRHAGGEPVRPGSMGKPLPGFGLEVRRRGRAAAPRTASWRSTRDRARRSSSGYLGRAASRDELWRTGDRVRRDDDGYLWFEGRLDDVILSAGYRIGPFEVESALVEHPAVAEAAAVAAPDAERGSVVRAVVVLRDGLRAGRGARARAAGPRQALHGAVQVPAHRRVRAPSCQRPRAARSSAPQLRG